MNASSKLSSKTHHLSTCTRRVIINSPEIEAASWPCRGSTHTHTDQILHRPFCCYRNGKKLHLVLSIYIFFFSPFHDIAFINISFTGRFKYNEVATKMCQIWKTYEERLKEMQLTTLRERKDLITIYKLMNSLDETDGKNSILKRKAR